MDAMEEKTAARTVALNVMGESAADPFAEVQV
jgi:hypothetical protein